MRKESFDLELSIEYKDVGGEVISMTENPMMMNIALWGQRNGESTRPKIELTGIAPLTFL